MTLPGDAAPSPADEAVRKWLAARAQAEPWRHAVLASDSDRERVCELLSSAFGEGRLTSAELDERTSRALSARTHGDLEGVLDGLAEPGSLAMWTGRARGGIVRRLLFWFVGLFTAPFVFLGSMIVLFGDDAGDRIVGIVLLVVFLPGLIALYRWAHPRA